MMIKTWAAVMAQNARPRLGSRLGGVRARRTVRFATCAVTGVLCLAVALAAAGCTHPASSSAGRPHQAMALHARPAPAGWQRATLPGGGAVLAFPPSMHLVHGDAGTVSAAKISASGRYLLYLNVTPKQGNETLSGWAAFRLNHQRDEETPDVHELAEQTGVRFLGGTGSCVTDSYVTKVGANHYTEIACFVRGRTSATVIVAAAPTADWASAAAVLRRAVAGYQVH